MLFKRFQEHKKRDHAATAAANITYLDFAAFVNGRLLALLCASIHYRHKALDVSPRRCTSICITALWHPGDGQMERNASAGVN